MVVLTKIAKIMKKSIINPRLIARLDIKAPNLIKSIQLEGLRKMGDPNEFAQKYYNQGIDEIIYMDIVASLYNRNSLLDIVKRTSDCVFVPITVGGGIRTIQDAKNALSAGADKIAVNTAAINDENLISEIAAKFGSQCMVISIEAKANGINHNGVKQYEAYTDNGRERTGKNVVEWALRAEKLGAGEILLTAVDNEGTRKGFDYDLIAQITAECKIPVIASGGCGKSADIVQAINESHADAVAIADILHYNRAEIQEIKEFARQHGVAFRV